MRRQSTALYGLTGAVARGDLEYRMTRHTTLGADYRFTYFDYTRGFRRIHRYNRWVSTTAPSCRAIVQFSARMAARAWRVQSLTQVALDPAMAALLGESVAIQAAYQLNYVPDIEARLTDTFRDRS